MKQRSRPSSANGARSLRWLAGAAVTQQLLNAGCAFGTWIKLEDKIGRVTQAERISHLMADEARGAREALDRFGCAGAALEMRKEHPAVTQVVSHLHARDADAFQARVAQAPHQHQREFAQ